MTSLFKKYLSLDRLLALTLLTLTANVMAVSHVSGEVPYENIEATVIPLVDGPKTILGQSFKYPSGTPLINAFNIDIPVGKKTSLHKHAVPLFVYVVSGEMIVDYGSKGKRTFKAGAAYIEAIEWCHIAQAVGNQPAKIIGVYLGQEKPDQIKPETCSKPN
jgi:quercetin dioxygenase-like cupin family protein